VHHSHSEVGNSLPIESSSFDCQLPPIIVKATDATISTKTFPTEKKQQPSSNQSSPLKKSEIDQIVQEAKRNRDKRNATNPGERTKRTSKQFQERSLLPRRQINRKTYKVIKAQQVATTRSLVLGQQVPATSEVIDLECTDASSTTTTETKGQLLRINSTDSLLQSRNTQSQSNLSAAQGSDSVPRRNMANNTSVEDAEKSKRKVQVRVGSVTSSKSVPGFIGTRVKKGPQDAGKNKTTQEPQIHDKWARKTKYWGAASKPLVKKIAFSSQPDSQISPHPLYSSSGVGDSDSNSVSDKGLTTDDSTDTSQHLKQPYQKQKSSLPTHQPWRSKRRHGALSYNNQPTKSRYPLHSRKLLSVSKGRLF